MELSLSELRRRLLTLIDTIPREGITITRHGEPIARLIPIEAPRQGRRVRFPQIRSTCKPGALHKKTQRQFGEKLRHTRERTSVLIPRRSIRATASLRSECLLFH
jgi:prevent-host-death family protein